MPRTEPTRLERIGHLLIHPDVFISKRNMTEFDRLELIPRMCYICGRDLNWREFLQSAHAFGRIADFGMDLLKEIWENDIFILQCCSCFRGCPRAIVSRSFDALDSINHSVREFIEREME